MLKVSLGYQLGPVICNLHTIATDAFPLSDSFAFPRPFRGKLVDRFFDCG